MESAGKITLLLHFIGLGLLVTLSVAGFVVDSQYRKAKDLQTKATLLRVMRPIGLLSPVAILLMAVTGIGNMHAFQYTMQFSWLSNKITVFVIAAILGTFMGIISRKRGALVGKMLTGEAPQNADATLSKYDSMVRIVSFIMPVLLLVILYFSVIGRLGAQ
ncbi:MAG: hypothetical protein HY960_15245 [Ignavibacteriae bacterium]|nr:hypothetical protein [Ignavibacteriota bacterium]